MTKYGASAIAVASALAGVFSLLSCTPCVGFQLPAGSGVHAVAKSRIPAACTRIYGSNEDLSSRQDDGQSVPVDILRLVDSNARKEIAMLVLSALVLGGSGLPQGANAVAQRDTVRSMDLPSQERLIADLESRLLSLPEKAEIIATDTPSGGDQPESVAGSTTNGPVTGSKTALVAGLEAPEPSQVSQAPPQVELPSPVATSISPDTRTMRSPSQPLVTFQKRTISITVPEFNLPQMEPIPPITLPESGLGLPEIGRVQAPPSVLGVGDMFRQAANKIGEGTELLRSLSGMAPKQSEYERAVAGFQERVRGITENAENPAFASGVPLASEFNALFSSAKRTAFDSVLRPFVGPKADPDFAFLVLATLPVLTVALRTADTNSRQPMSPCQPPKVKKPRLVKFPNSPAKVDREAVEEARAMAAAAKEAAAKKAEMEAVKSREAAKIPVDDSGSEAATPETFMVIPEATRKAVARELLTGVGLGREVAAAVTADAESLQAELSRLKKELRVAGELGSKVRALEEANLRLTAKVEELLKRPTPEEALEMVEEQKARELVQKERAAKLEQARERLADVLARPVVEEGVSLPSGRGAYGAAGRSSRGADRDTVAVVRAAGVTAQEFEAKVEQAGGLAVAAAAKAMASTYGAVLARSRPGVSSSSSSKSGVIDRGDETAAGSPPQMREDTATASEIAAIVSDLEADVGAAASTRRAVVGASVEAPTENIEGNMGASGRDRPGAGVGAGAGTSTNGARVNAQDAPVPTPDDYDSLGEGLSKALSGVRGFDLDALDLEMEDLRGEDIEELRRLEKEMGEVSMASLEPELDEADREAFTEALIMAEESAAMADSEGTIPDDVSPLSDGRLAGGVGGPVASGMPTPPGMFSPEAGVVPVGQGTAGGVNGDFGEAVGVGAAGDDWGTLSPSALKRKTVAELKGFLQERGVPARGKPKKAELVEKVTELLQVA